MTKHIKKEIYLAIGVVVLIGPCMFWQMTPALYVAVHAALIAFFALFAILIWREKSTDEREVQHKAIASDIAFTVGGALLAIAMIYQTYTEIHVDVWLIAILGGMIFTRVITRIWLSKNN